MPRLKGLSDAAVPFIPFQTKQLQDAWLTRRSGRSWFTQTTRGGCGIVSTV